MTGKRSDAVYCSRTCKDRSRRTGWRASETCLWCGEPIPATAAPNALYCSRKCRDAQYRITYADQRKAGIDRWREENAGHIRQYSAEYYAANREQIAERGKARYAADPVRRGRQRATSDAWKANNPERVREYYHARYWADPEQYRLLSTEYAKANPAIRAQRQRLRKALILDGALLFSQSDWEALVRRLEGCCAYCGKVPADGLTMDHVVPLSRGGRHALGNILPACRSCNSSKHNRYLIEWRHSGLAPEGPFLA